MITGISNGKQYTLYKYDGLSGLCDLAEYSFPQWCRFEKIYVDGVLMESE